MPTTPPDEGDERGAQRRSVRRGGELLAVHDQECHDRQGEHRPLEVTAPGEVQDHADGQGPHGDHERPPLAPPHPPGQGQQPDPDQGHQGTGRLAGDEGEKLQHQVESAPQGRRDGGEDVDDPGHGDGPRPPPSDTARTAAHRTQVRGGRPRGAVGVGGHHHGMGVVHLAVARRHALEEGGPGKLRPGEQQAHVQFGAGLELHPGELLAGQEDREQAQSAPVLLDDLTGRTGARQEPGTEVRQLGLQGRSADEPGVPAAAQRPRRVAHLVVGGGAGRRQRVLEEPVELSSPSVRHALRATYPSTTARITSSATQITPAKNSRAPHAADRRALYGSRRRGLPEDEVVESRRDEGDPQGDGDGEGHEQPPGEAREAAVEKP